MTSQDHDRTRHPHPPRWPLSLLTPVAALLGAAAIALTVTAPTGRGTTHPDRPDRRAQIGARLDADQARLAQAQATADRFAGAFGDYLAGTATARRLHAAGASKRLVDHIEHTPTRIARDTAAAGGRRRTKSGRGDSRPVATVEARERGWLGTATLTAPGAPSVPVAFRLEPRAGRVVVIDVNAGGQD